MAMATASVIIISNVMAVISSTTTSTNAMTSTFPQHGSCLSRGQQCGEIDSRIDCLRRVVASPRQDGGTQVGTFVVDHLVRPGILNRIGTGSRSPTHRQLLGPQSDNRT